MTEQTAPPEPTTIIARVLPADAWGRLSQAELAQHLDPAHSIVVVVEEGGPGGEILAEWAAMTCVHVEGLLVRGGAGVARALLQCMVEALVNTGVREVLTQAETDLVRGMIEEAGGSKVPGDTWVIPITPLG
jgi:hypothetical protein